MVIADGTLNLLLARWQMALTLGVHIILACFGVGFPILLLAAHALALRGNAVAGELAYRWSKSFAVLFAVGAVTGTVLSFELGLLWPGFMGTWGSVIGLPFTLEGFAFFLEAIFVGIYIYGRQRLPPLVHWWTAVPIALAGIASAWFVVTANAWMNSPQGFDWDGVRPINPQPLRAMFNPAMGAQTTHMILAALMTSGFCSASYYAWRILFVADREYERLALRISLAMACAITPVQLIVGDWSAKVVAQYQPVKFAAMESHFHTESSASLLVGGVPNQQTRQIAWGLRIPYLLSFLAHGDFHQEVVGLEEFPVDVQPPVIVVHTAFQLMVACGVLLLGLALYYFHWVIFRSRRPLSSKFLYAALPSGLLSVIALEAGWVVTEVGRQPWIVQGWMKTADAVTNSDQTHIVFMATLAIYGALGIGPWITLRQLARRPLEHAGK